MDHLLTFVGHMGTHCRKPVDSVEALIILGSLGPVYHLKSSLVSHLPIVEAEHIMGLASLQTQS